MKLANWLRQPNAKDSKDGLTVSANLMKGFYECGIL